MALFGLNAFIGSNLIGGTVREGMYSEVGVSPRPQGRIPVGRGGSIRRLQVEATVNNLDGICVLTVLKNGAPTALTVTYGIGETGAKSNDTPVSVSAADKVSYLVDSSAATAGAINLSASAEFIPA